LNISFLFGRHEKKLAVAQGFGINTSKNHEPFKQSFNLVVEASGNQSGLLTALELIKPRGTIVLKSTYHGNVNIDTSKLVIDEVVLIGSRCGRFQPAINVLKQGLVNVTDLITASYSATEYRQAFNAAQQTDAFKIILNFTI